MKAHIVKDPRCVLLWHFDAATPGYDALQRAAKTFQLTVRQVTDADLAATVGDLCSGKPAPGFAPLPALPDTPAMIVSGLRHDNGDLNAFIDAVKNGGAELPIRAAVTPTSRKWTLLQLLQELHTEHAEVNKA